MQCAKDHATVEMELIETKSIERAEGQLYQCPVCFRKVSKVVRRLGREQGRVKLAEVRKKKEDEWFKP